MKTKNVKSVKGGYQVSIMRQGQVRIKLFKIEEHSSDAKTFAAAKEFRDRITKEMPRSFKDLGIHSKCRSNTGIVGVTETASRRRGKSFPCFTVSARPARKKVLNKKFYFQEGNARTKTTALDEAKQWREHVLANR